MMLDSARPQNPSSQNQFLAVLSSENSTRCPSSLPGPDEVSGELQGDDITGKVGVLGRFDLKV